MYASEFTAPGPGAWELETAHLSRPISRWVAEVWPPALRRGFAEGSRNYGLLLETIDFRVVNGFAYGQLRPVGAPPGATKPPPRLIFKLVTWFHPEIRRRLKRIKEVFEQRSWRADIERWYNEYKPAIRRKNASIQAIDPATLDNEGLIKHVSACEQNVSEAIFRHHSLNPVPMVAPGEFLLDASEWTSKPVSELLLLLKGSSPASLGADAELARLVELLRATDTGLLDIEPPEAAIDALVAREDELGEAAREYVDLVSYRMMSGYDIADKYVRELPALFVRTIKSALNANPAQVTDAYHERLASIRDAVPDAHRETFDSRLDEARACFAIRDERGYHNDSWAMGLARRSLLEAGRRLVERGRLHDVNHVVDLTPKEVLDLLAGNDGPPSADEVAAYARYRETKTSADAPPFLGAQPGPPPPAEWLPPHAARMMRIVNMSLHHMMQPSAEVPEGKLLRGLGASQGSYTGTARLALSPSDFERIQQGDVLVARATAPAYNVLLPLIGAVVTERGGLLSHAAIVAREYGLPAVVGCSGATKEITDGAEVRVDGDSGEVEVLG